MNRYEDLLVVMIEFVRSSQSVFLTIPFQRLMGQADQ